MDLGSFDGLVTSFAGVRRASGDGDPRWDFRGRLIARGVDATHVVVRVPLDVRDVLIRHHPGVFSVPNRFARHMMVVADLESGDDGALEDAVTSAWRMQSQDTDGQGSGERQPDGR